MRYYIEAYDGDDRQILGNLDGQASLGPCVLPTVTSAWKSLIGKRPAWSRVFQWKLVDENDNVIAVRKNVQYQK